MDQAPEAKHLPQWDEAALILDVTEAEVATMLAERLACSRPSSHTPPFEYISSFCAQSGPLLHHARQKLTDRNELPPIAIDEYNPPSTLFSAPPLDDETRSETPAPVVRPGRTRLFEDAADKESSTPVQGSVARRYSRKRPISVATTAPIARRRLLSNRCDVAALLHAGALCISDLSLGDLERVSRWEVNGRHGHAANLFLSGTPAVVVSARYCPPAAWREKSTLISVTLTLSSGSADSVAHLPVSTSQSAPKFSSYFIVECTCKISCSHSTQNAVVPGSLQAGERLHNSCDHSKGVLSLFVSETGHIALGSVLKDLLLKATSTGDNDGEARMSSALAMSISSTKLLADIVAVTWGGVPRRGGAVPVLIHLTKRVREESVRVYVTCGVCVSDNIRPNCVHEKESSADPNVKSSAASEARRICGSAPGSAIEAIGTSGDALSSAPAPGMSNRLILDGDRRAADFGGNSLGHKKRGSGASHEVCDAEEWEELVRAAAETFGTPDASKSYRGYARRSAYPCLSDLDIIPARALAVRDSKRDDSKALVRLVDMFGACSSCRRNAEPLLEKCAAARCVALVQFDGTHLVGVRDWICGSCGHTNCFEGLDTGTFSMTRSMIFDRRVLDWLVAFTLRYCGTGRCAYAALMDAREDAAEAHESVRISDEVQDVGRREFSEAIAAYISILGDAPGNPASLASVFACQGGGSPFAGAGAVASTCDDAAVAVDATASGILDQLPVFEQDSLVVECLSTRHNSRHHLLRGKHEREGVRHLFRNSLSLERGSNDLASAVLADLDLPALEQETDSESDSSDEMEEDSPDDEHLDLRDVDSDASGYNPDINEGGATIQLSQLHSKSCRVAPATRRARNRAVLNLVQEHSTNRLRNVKSVAAYNLDKRCDADCIEILPGVEKIDEEADELEELASEVVGLALRDAFDFWNDDEDSPSDTEINHASVTPGSAEAEMAPARAEAPQAETSAAESPSSLPQEAGQLDSEEADAHRPPGADSEPIESSSPTQYSSRHNRKSPNVASRRAGVDVTLFAAYITLLMLLLSDPIQAVWGGCDGATEAWIRNLCFLLMQLSASVSLEQLKVDISALQRAAGNGLGQCPSLLRFVAEMCSVLGQESSTWSSNRLKVSLLLSQSASRLCLLALRQCRLFSRVSATFSSESAAAYSKSFEKPGFRWSLPWSVDEARRSGHMYPGRRPVRPGVNFTGHHGNACSKEYVASSGPSPGVVVVTCVCGNKIVLEFSLLARKESLSIIASILLRYFPDVRVVFYDAACNFFSSIVNILLWFAAGVRDPRFLIDVFHKLCHTCGVCFCAKTQINAVGAHKDPRTSNVESANKQLAGIKKSFLRVRSSNAMSILTIRFLFINLLSLWRMETGSDDTEDADLGAICNRLMQCRCGRCKTSRNAPGEEGEEFAFREASMHASVTKRKAHNAGSSARNATAAAQDVEDAQLRARMRVLIGDRRMIGSLGGRK